MRTIGWIICAGILAAATSAGANPVINLGHYYIIKDASAPAEVLVSDSGNVTTEDIEGMQFTLQVGTGALSTPSIGSVDFLTGTIWAGRVSPANINPVVVTGGGPQLKSWGLLTDNPGFVNANGRLATVNFGAVSAVPGDYLIKLTGMIESGANSKFYNGVAPSVPTTFADGTLTVVIRGDYDRDNQLTAGDISAALAALSNLNSYETMKGLTDAGLLAVGDVDVSDGVDNRDLQSLLVVLANAASGGGGTSVVPEPATWSLAGCALMILPLVGKRINKQPARLRRKRSDVSTTAPPIGQCRDAQPQ